MKNSFSSVIVGCMDWGSWRRNFDTSEMTELIEESVSLGLTSFDHADIYGDYTVEEQFGKALDKANVSRQDLQIISKCGIQYSCEARPHSVKHYQYDTAYIIESAERSIAHLQCDYLDLLASAARQPSPSLRIFTATSPPTTRASLLSVMWSTTCPRVIMIMRSQASRSATSQATSSPLPQRMVSLRPVAPSSRRHI